MENCHKFDNALFSMLQECNGLPLFLDAIFGFLNRRTDFYSVATEPNSPVGLPEGWAEEYVRRSFYKWKPKETKNFEKLIIKEIPDVVTEVEVSTSNEMPTTGLNENYTDEYHELPQIEEDFSSSECYNGAAYKNYSWAQSINEIDISVKVPEKVTTKQLSVDIQTKRISVKLRNTGEPLVEGELCYKCKHQEAIWSLDKMKLQIHLEKTSEVWWNCLTLNEPKLDISKIDCSRPYEDLSDEAQSKIEELTWNQERKRLGLPTSEEMVMHEKLKKAWNAPGSPFRGPFDPSSVILK